jgi:hypothetical protein
MLARQAFRDTSAMLQPALAREPPLGILPPLVAALVSLACTNAGRSLALCPLESLSSGDAVYLRRFRVLAREMVKLALTRAAGRGDLRRCDFGLLARALVNDADFLGRALAHVDEDRARDSARYVFAGRLRAYLARRAEPARVESPRASDDRSRCSAGVARR